jgi:hypothetical protein
MRTILGVVLIAVGVVGLIWGGITYVKDRDTVDLGVAEITVQEKETVPIPPLVSGLALVAGTAVLLVGRRRVA